MNDLSPEKPEQTAAIEEQAGVGSPLPSEPELEASDTSATSGLIRGVPNVELASLLCDTGHEIDTTLLPGFQIGALPASAPALGSTEAFSGLPTALAKLFAGPAAHDRRQPARMASRGYLGRATASGVIGSAGCSAGWMLPSLLASGATGITTPESKGPS